MDALGLYGSDDVQMDLDEVGDGMDDPFTAIDSAPGPPSFIPSHNYNEMDTDDPIDLLSHHSSNISWRDPEPPSPVEFYRSPSQFIPHKSSYQMLPPSPSFTPSRSLSPSESKNTRKCDLCGSEVHIDAQNYKWNLHRGSFECQKKARRAKREQRKVEDNEAECHRRSLSIDVSCGRSQSVISAGSRGHSPSVISIDPATPSSSHHVFAANPSRGRSQSVMSIDSDTSFSLQHDPVSMKCPGVSSGLSTFDYPSMLHTIAPKKYPFRSYQEVRIGNSDPIQYIRALSCRDKCASSAGGETTCCLEDNNLPGAFHFGLTAGKINGVFEEWS
ncbi:hypothetical protein BT96DRAFT_972246 [Gymnopus androsaceus JB14]|uniref:Uncharacterized protein n=1 Tax=Gymnopus androsaceus JB14 TaxID=1447944 RepID=A0A6A4I758_9AGAR|nr:hypothetical protein BT96DRAFT_972246 [Gymnopus androsaceus JB14]